VIGAAKARPGRRQRFGSVVDVTIDFPAVRGLSAVAQLTALLGTSQARCHLPERAFAQP